MNNPIDQDLPDEIQTMVGDDHALKQARLNTLSMLVSRRRDEAVAGRAASGIETIWQEDEDAYEGFDDANRSESRVIKGSTNAGGLTRSNPGGATRSTMFLNITRPYVDSAAARVSDMLMPTDDRSFEVKVEPVPEMTAHKDNLTPAVDPATNQPLMKAAPPEQPGQPAPEPVPATHADLAEQLMETAKASAEAAQKRIDDWLTECGYQAEKRKAIHDCAKLGACVLKGPFPVKRSAKMVNQGKAGIELAIMEDIKPSSKRVDVWNFYPDPACGENIHNGNYILEKDYMTVRQLMELIGVPGYLEDQIRECIKEGPQKENIGDRQGKERKNLYEVWYYYGSVDRDELKAADCNLADKNGDTQYAVITMVNDRTIKAALNHLDSGEFPYDCMPWQVRSGSWAGIGVARQMRAPQGMIVAGSRNMMDNAALSGGPILAINRSMLEPADGHWSLSPRKMFYTTDDAEGADIRMAIASFNIPSQQAELMGIIQFAMKMAEEVTGLPALLQGQTGNAPDTLGGQILANNNASTVLRRIARLDDDYMTKPHIRRYYEYLLIYGPEESEKGQFTIDARGSSVLVERDIQNHATISMLQLSVNPAFGADPKKAFAEACRVQRLDPKRFQYSPEELAKMAQQPAAPPVQIAVEQMKGQNALQLQQAKAQAELQMEDQQMAKEQQMLQNGQATPHMATATARIEQERIRAHSSQIIQASRASAELARAEKEQQIAQQNGEFDIRKMEMQRELALLQYANDQKISLDQVKAQLAKSAMDNQTKKELAAAEIQLAQNEGHQNRVLDVHKHQTSLVRDEMSTPETP